MIIEHLKAKGTLVIELRDEHGNIKDYREENNLVVDLGLAFIASRMQSADAPVVSHMAVGTGGTAENGSQTTLVNESYRQSLSATTLTTTNVANDTVQYQASFAAGNGTGELVEAGLFNASSAGTMVSRTVFAPVNKGPLDTLTITWKINIQ